MCNEQLYVESINGVWENACAGMETRSFGCHSEWGAGTFFLGLFIFCEVFLWQPFWFRIFANNGKFGTIWWNYFSLLWYPAWMSNKHSGGTQIIYKSFTIRGKIVKTANCAFLANINKSTQVWVLSVQCQLDPFPEWTSHLSCKQAHTHSSGHFAWLKYIFNWKTERVDWIYSESANSR